MSSIVCGSYQKRSQKWTLGGLVGIQQNWENGNIKNIMGKDQMRMFQDRRSKRGLYPAEKRAEIE